MRRKEKISMILAQVQNGFYVHLRSILGGK